MLSKFILWSQCGPIAQITKYITRVTGSIEKKMSPKDSNVLNLSDKAEYTSYICMMRKGGHILRMRS